MPKTSFYSGSGLDADDFSNLEQLKIDAQTAKDEAEASKDAAAASATEAADSENAAAASATSAASYLGSVSADASSASSSASAAQTAQTASETAQTASETAQAASEAAQVSAETAQTAAESAKAGAETAESNASTSEVNASASATAAATSASNASTSEINASSHKDDAETAKTAAETAQAAAETAQAAAETAKTGAETAETNSASSASASATSATAAATSATAASTSAGQASTSATNAAASAASAATSETNAAASATSAAASYDSFDDRYLGAKASDPTLDNDGDALVTGAIYFDSANDVMKVYNGTEWQNASSSVAGIRNIHYYTATASQTAFSGSDDNALTMIIDKADLCSVYMNGVRLHEDDYTVDLASNTVTLAAAAQAGDLLEIEVFGNFTGQAGSDVSISGGTIDGVVIGSTTAGAITGTTGQFNTSLNVDGTTTTEDLTVTGAFTSQGIDDNATSTAMTLDSSGHLLVGTTDSQLNNESTNTGVVIRADNQIQIARSGGVTAYFNRLTSDGDIVQFRKDGSNVGSIRSRAGQVSTIILDPRAGGNGIAGTSTGFYPTDQDGEVKDAGSDLGYSAARFKDLYLSGGVYLGGTVSANLLDDYEEGTWTPTMNSVTLTTDHGAYTKVGGLVTAQFQIVVPTNTVTANAQLSGLPFTPNNSTQAGRSMGFLTYNPSSQAMTLLLQSGTSFISFRKDGDGTGSNTSVQALGGNVYWGTLIYRTSS